MAPIKRTVSEFLLLKGYAVHGIIRRSSSFNTGRIEHLYHDKHIPGASFTLHYGDLVDSANLVSIITKVQPDEIYNLGAQSHVKVSFDVSEYTAEVDGVGTLRLLDAIRSCGMAEKVRFYQASTSELYGGVYNEPQDEKTPFHPRSPYACAKLYAYWIVVNYREAYNMHCSNGILFNHESPRRGETFVTRKITRAVARITRGLQECLYLGNLDARRDWGHAKDYVEAMWMILQQDKSDDYVCATNEMHTVREFCEKSFALAGVTIEWKGPSGTVNEYAVDAKTGKTVIKVDPQYFRPTEVDQLQGNPEKAKRILGWTPKISFEQLVDEMVREDIKLADDEKKRKQQQ